MDDLYHPRILELAGDMPHVGRLDAPDGASTKVSRVCGSVVTVELKLADGVVSEIAVHPKACALGQAATGVLAMHAIGATPDEIRAARDGLRAMLKDGAPAPGGRFWELRHLEGVREYPARHASTMLAFDAAVDALDQAKAKAR
ncbi:iron-sulfur cluster assembly scaffold protein [Terricaulis silvestris]|uniref:SUF system FeS assembly protein, NifU family n=1 Tax=Terricaulis silvestris TaxID=2686094 RepID=A0A6I6MM08_9CAUL|nr:iron-sulfur cluster assembly scaffold protein [Terricaulis silvestris]QGZ94348.1 SUF system FeS assembly protein, NifU family [Terricaulis silvestris]